MSTNRTAWEDVQKLEVDELRLEVEPGGCVRMTGSLTLRDPYKVLLPVFQSLHKAALHDGLTRVVVDISGLSFVNSSGIRVFVDWVLWLREEPPTRRYKLAFRSTTSHAWQRASLPVLQSLAPAWIQVERA